jgi:hypothetical protein
VGAVIGVAVLGDPVTPRLGLAAALRCQLTPRIVWDVGVGTEFAGPADRSKMFLTTGPSFGF